MITPSPTANAQDVRATHTPGPWLRIDTADYAEIHAQFRPSSQAVALVGKPADADLIAAAPEMLSVLVRIERACNGASSNTVDRLIADLARAAIAKATAA